MLTGGRVQDIQCRGEGRAADNHRTHQHHQSLGKPFRPDGKTVQKGVELFAGLVKAG